ncbi:MAG: ankyrin repeat domain-containing protein [Pseudomonas sp.]|uniref:ankyrin repeat domain-containing protein n=1 Tax=Pseudomonas sp. TaxID=306 RepID=UPI003393C4A1
MSKALLKAAAAGRIATLQTLLEAGIAIDFADRMPGRTALIEATIAGQTDTVEFLLKQGANPDCTDAATGSTPLSWAAMQGYVEIIDLLLTANAQVDKDNSPFKHSPLMGAAQNGHLDVVTRLLAAGANLHGQTVNGRNALSRAEESGHTEVVALLKAQGARAPVPLKESTLPWPVADGGEIDDSEPASVLRGFILAMHRWETQCYADHQRSGNEHIDWQPIQDGQQRVFERFCTAKPRTYGRQGSFGFPPAYSPDETLVKLDLKGRAARLMTRQGPGASVRYECLYGLVSKGGTWRIDTKQQRPWGTLDWSRTLL